MVSIVLTMVFVFLTATAWIEIGKKKRDEKRVDDMLRIQKAIDQYYSEKQVFPFAQEQNGENYLRLMQQYIRSATIPYDPNPNWAGDKNGHPECYQFAEGKCYGRYVFDTSGNTWYMQVALERKTIFNGQCSFPAPINRYCISYQRLDNPY
jgi:hypothetical protein